MNVKSRVTRAVLTPFAKAYELGVRLRIAAYETDYLKAHKLDSAVVSIGNVTFGGTGKTPLVRYLAEFLQQEGYSVAILTRGHGRKSRGQRVLNDPLPVGVRASGGGSTATCPSYLEFGDEPVMLARALPGVPIVVNKKRVEAGKWAERELGSQVMILDDGYQHLALGRDLNLLVLDATDPFGSFEMAPFGTLREPLYALRRADAVIVSRAHRPFDQAQLIKMVQFFRGDKIPIMYVYSSIVGMKHITTGDRYEAKQFNGWNATVMCGIGNPRAFSSDLLQIGLGISSEHFFADHYRYTPEDVAQVTQAAHDAGADMIVTTEKDAVRLEGLALGDIPVYAAELAIESEDEVRLKSLLLRSLLVKKKA